MAGRKISIEIVGDSRGLVKAFKVSSKAASSWHSKIGRMAKIGTAGIAGLIGSAAGLSIAIGIKAVKAASNLGEQINKVRVIFQGAAKGIKHWSLTTASGIGVSEEKALEFVGVFGNMFAPMGIANKKSAQMSKSLVKLAADMASFNNVSPEDALTALQAGLAGQVRPLRRLGVFLSADRVKAEALSSGIVTTTKDMGAIHKATLDVSDAVLEHTKAVRKYGPASKQAQRATVQLEIAQERLTKATAGTAPKLNAAQKALATYNIIMRDTKNAHGDFRRTLGISLPNAMRVLHAQISDLMGAFGKGLIPVVLRASQALRTKLADPKVRAWVQHMGFIVGTKLYNAFIAIGKWFDAHWPGIKQGFHQAYLILKKMVGTIKWIADHTPNASPSANPFKGGAFFKRDIFSDSDWKSLPGWAKRQFTEKGYTRTHDKQGHIHIYLDGREITKSVTKNQQRSGKSAPHQTRGRHGGNAFAIPG